MTRLVRYMQGVILLMSVENDTTQVEEDLSPVKSEV